MAIQILRDFNEIFPIINKNYLAVTSDNTNKSRFQYLCDIHLIDTGGCQSLTSSSIGQLRVQPDPQGRGIIEVNNIIKDYIDYDFELDMTIKNLCDKTKNWLIYTAYIGESYVNEWIADDFVFITPADPGLSQLCLTTTGFSNTEHDYVVGDIIMIDSPDETLVKSGIWRITEIVDNKTVRINQFWQQSGAAISIKTSYADGRRTDFPGLSQSEGVFAFNGHLDYEEWFYFKDEEWIIGKPNRGRLITGIPNRKCIGCDSGYQNFTNDFDRIYWWSEVGDMFGAQWASLEPVELVVQTKNSIQTRDLGIIQLGSFGFGPENLSRWGITINEGEDYLVYLRVPDCCDGDICKTSDKILMKWKPIDCSDTNVKLVFYDELGGWSTLNLNKRFSKRSQIDKTLFRGENLKDFLWDGESEKGEFCGDPRKSGDQVVSSKWSETFSASSQFLEEEEVKYIEQLFKSRKVFWMKKETDLSRWYPYPVNIINRDWTYNSVLIHRFRTVDIEWRMANITDTI